MLLTAERGSLVTALNDLPVTSAAALEGRAQSSLTTLRLKQHEDEYLRVLAHRLRNRLAPLRTCIQLLENRAPQDRLLHQALDLMDRQIRRLSSLLDDLYSDNGPAGSAPMPEVQHTRTGEAEAGSVGADEADGSRVDRALRGLGIDMPGEANDTVINGRPLNLKQRVLIVDDNLDAAEALRLLLCIKGFEAFTASDGMEAIERTQECSPDIIFMDLEMPNMDGWEAARRIHAMPECAAIPIVALTGLDHDLDRERSRESGMVEHLVKPVEMAVVQDVMQSLVPLGPAYRRLRM